MFPYSLSPLMSSPVTADIFSHQLSPSLPLHLRAFSGILRLIQPVYRTAQCQGFNTQVNSKGRHIARNLVLCGTTLRHISYYTFSESPVGFSLRCPQWKPAKKIHPLFAFLTSLFHFTLSLSHFLGSTSQVNDHFPSLCFLQEPKLKQ